MRIVRYVALSVVATAVLGLAPAGWALEHVVTPDVAQAALDSAAGARAADQATLELALRSPQAERAASQGLPVAETQRALASLSDGEIHDLAARARALGLDPVTGRFDADVEDMLVLFLLVALVILVLKNV